ncbi:MAG TPA: hypothetical protein HPQ00_00675 [Magnetococcales bacterium]|nr:hypothetical protein [Magnetococcales bacterium]
MLPPVGELSHAVELVVGIFLVAFDFKDYDDADVSAELFTQETLQHLKIGLAAEQAFQVPVEADQLPLFHFCWPSMKPDEPSTLKN